MPERSSPGGEPTIDAQLSPSPTAVEREQPAPATRHTRRWFALGGVGLIAAAVVVLDQISKAGVVQQWGPAASSHHLPVVPGVLELDYVENRGAAFGLLPNAGWGLAIIAAIAIGVILYLVPRLQSRPHGAPWHLLLALGLVLGGALGNLIDRLQHGYVVDFITPRFAQIMLGDTLYRFPTFNVADSAITVGVLILLVGFLLLPEEAGSKQPASGVTMKNVEE